MVIRGSRRHGSLCFVICECGVQESGRRGRTSGGDCGWGGSASGAGGTGAVRLQHLLHFDPRQVRRVEISSGNRYRFPYPPPSQLVTPILTCTEVDAISQNVNNVHSELIQVKTSLDDYVLVEGYQTEVNHLQQSMDTASGPTFHIFVKILAFYFRSCLQHSKLPPVF